MTINSRNIPRNISILIITIIVIGYIIFNFRIFMAGPQIVFKSPANGSVSEKNLVEIEGLANNISQIFLNDRQIFVNEYNEFIETVLLYPGHNVFVVKARDKFDRETTNKMEIIYAGQEMKPKIQNEPADNVPDPNDLNSENNAKTENESSFEETTAEQILSGTGAENGLGAQVEMSEDGQ